MACRRDTTPRTPAGSTAHSACGSGVDAEVSTPVSASTTVADYRRIADSAGLLPDFCPRWRCWTRPKENHTAARTSRPMPAIRRRRVRPRAHGFSRSGGRVPGPSTRSPLTARMRVAGARDARSRLGRGSVWLSVSRSGVGRPRRSPPPALAAGPRPARNPPRPCPAQRRGRLAPAATRRPRGQRGRRGRRGRHGRRRSTHSTAGPPRRPPRRPATGRAAGHGVVLLRPQPHGVRVPAAQERRLQPVRLLSRPCRGDLAARGEVAEGSAAGVSADPADHRHRRSQGCPGRRTRHCPGSPASSGGTTN